MHVQVNIPIIWITVLQLQDHYSECKEAEFELDIWAVMKRRKEDGAR
jgi:hypothetical protein